MCRALISSATMNSRDTIASSWRTGRSDDSHALSGFFGLVGFIGFIDAGGERDKSCIPLLAFLLNILEDSVSG